MLEQLNIASEHLSIALERYIHVCLGVRESYTRENTFPKITYQHSRQMDTELATIASYDTQLQRAKLAISQVRNFSLDLVPVHSLPPELVTRIFQFALAPEPHEPDWSQDPKGVGFPQSPDYLAQVCSRWRQIAFASPSLWSHLNFALHMSRYQGHLPRALSYVARASQLPLRLYISEPCEIKQRNPSVFEFIGSIASRVLALEYHSGGIECLAPVLRSLLSNSRAGTLTKLVTNSTSGHLNSFLLTAETWTALDDNGLDNMSPCLDISDEQLEAIFAPLTILHLRAIFPRWGSAAYHNLVDLRLTSAFRYSWSSIREANLVSVLKASPGLRILHFALGIKHRSTEIVAVPLADLEVLNIKTVCTYAKHLEVGSILRLIAPGRRPLRLTIENAVYEEGPSMDETVQFFERSNITRFCAKEGYPPVKRLLPRTLNLEELVFSSCKLTWRANIDLSNDQYRASQSPEPAPFSWYIRESQVDLDDILVFYNDYHPRSLALANCDVYDAEYEEPLTEDELWEFSQSACFRSYEGLSPDPTANWDILD
ncbi:F-box-like domain protein, partial [Rhizoctonia solani AG-3 Rhs1AP]